MCSRARAHQPHARHDRQRAPLQRARHACWPMTRLPLKHNCRPRAAWAICSWASRPRLHEAHDGTGHARISTALHAWPHTLHAARRTPRRSAWSSAWWTTWSWMCPTTSWAACAPSASWRRWTGRCCRATSSSAASSWCVRAHSPLRTAAAARGAPPPPPCAPPPRPRAQPPSAPRAGPRAARATPRPAPARLAARPWAPPHHTLLPPWPCRSRRTATTRAGCWARTMACCPRTRWRCWCCLCSTCTTRTSRARWRCGPGGGARGGWAWRGPGGGCTAPARWQRTRAQVGSSSWEGHAAAPLRACQRWSAPAQAPTLPAMAAARCSRAAPRPPPRCCCSGCIAFLLRAWLPSFSACARIGFAVTFPGAALVPARVWRV